MVYKYDERNKREVIKGFSVVDIYKDKSLQMSYVIVNLNGEHGLCRNTMSTKYWIILDGNANVYLGDKKFKVKQGDFVIVDKNIKHNIIGNVKFGVICSPAFDSRTEEYF